VKTREEKEDEQEKRYKAEQDQIKHMKQYVAKFGQGEYTLQYSTTAVARCFLVQLRLCCTRDGC
jgi:ATPase subunit of ABC transporter with duplicated ATPase domains